MDLLKMIIDLLDQYCTAIYYEIHLTKTYVVSPQKRKKEKKKRTYVIPCNIFLVYYFRMNYFI